MKSSFLGCILCLIGFSGFSQNIVVKPGAGINISNFSKTPETGKFDGQVGYQIGGSVVFGKKFYVEPGIFYGQLSTKYTDNTTSVKDLTFNISGIQIPVAVGYNLIGHEKGAFNARVFAGGSVFIVTNVNQGQKSDYTSPTWGLFAGAGIDFLIFFVDLKYQWSLTNVAENSTDIGQSRTFFVNVGVKLPI
jgi:hypothetical protein